MRRHLFALAVLTACFLTALLAVECAEAKPWENAAYASLAADTATTCYGLERGFTEGNPIYGDSCAQVAVINAGIGYLLHRIGKRYGVKWPFKFTVGMRSSAVAWNLNQLRSH